MFPHCPLDVDAYKLSSSRAATIAAVRVFWPEAVKATTRSMASSSFPRRRARPVAKTGGDGSARGRGAAWPIYTSPGRTWDVACPRVPPTPCSICAHRQQRRWAWRCS
ncbi:unnamed protein product [Urochloa humidicola]